MRETFSRLVKTSQNYAVDDSTTSTNSLTDSRTFLKREVNNTVSFLFSKLRNFKTQPTPYTFTSTADRIYNHYPPNLLSIESVTVTIGDVAYPLQVVSSQAEWDKLQQIEITSDTVPKYYFPRQFDFGIFPTLHDAYTVTLVGNFLPKRMSADDYSTGTVAVSQNSTTVTGTDTAFTSSMVGRWFCEADSNGEPIGRWYRIASYTSATVIALESVFEETALSGATFLIGESPEVPEELHELIPFRAAAIYHGTVRKDTTRAQQLMNYFYTGDFGNTARGGGIAGGVIGVINRYKNLGSGNSQLVQLHRHSVEGFGRNEAWGTTLSAAA